MSWLLPVSLLSSDYSYCTVLLLVFFPGFLIIFYCVERSKQHTLNTSSGREMSWIQRRDRRYYVSYFLHNFLSSNENDTAVYCVLYVCHCNDYRYLVQWQNLYVSTSARVTKAIRVSQLSRFRPPLILFVELTGSVVFEIVTIGLVSIPKQINQDQRKYHASIKIPKMNDRIQK